MILRRAKIANDYATIKSTLIRPFNVIRPLISAPRNLTVRYPIFTRQIELTRQFVSQCSHHDQSPGVSDSDTGRSNHEFSLVESKGNDEKISSAGEQNIALPWYLRTESPQTSVQSTSEAQKIPSLPESSPPILEQIMNEISSTLGLDYMSLLDLRKLDPPPSLGANLLMLIATARSEKHLNISADRLCRWLRSKYKLRPKADGLLGRNQLKTRLKRKANKIKLIGNRLNKFDDGIRSNWICVDVGIVSDVRVETQQAIDTRNYIGFGRCAEGIRIVIQLFTAEKREEIALEKLWGVISKRGVQLEGPENFDENGFLIEESHDKINGTINLHKSYTTTTNRQIRSYHKSARDSSVIEQKSKNTCSQSCESSIDTSSIQNFLMKLLELGKYEQASEWFLKFSLNDSRLKNEQLSFLKTLLNHLKSLPKEKAIECLGNGFSDLKSTPFLVTYYEALSTLPLEARSEIHVELICYAHTLKHTGYGLSEIFTYQQKLALDGVKLSLKSYDHFLESILRSNSSRFATESAATIIATMHDQGFDVMNEDILVKLQLLTCRAEPPQKLQTSQINQCQSENFGFSSVHMRGVQERFHLLIVNFDSCLLSDANRMKLLNLYAEYGYWIQFWEIFRMAPRHGKLQGEEIYACMFTLIAKANNQKACCTVLRTWFPEMMRELATFSPNHKVIDAVKACLLIADPRLFLKSMSTEELNGDFGCMWKRCHE